MNKVNGYCIRQTNSPSTANIPELALPDTTLVALQVYVPISDKFTPTILSVLFLIVEFNDVSDIMYFMVFVIFTETPLKCQMMVGIGCPLA